MPSRKDYIATAQAMATLILDNPHEPGTKASGEYRDNCVSVSQALADVFAADNPRFDRAKFMAAACPTRDMGTSTQTGDSE